MMFLGSHSYAGSGRALLVAFTSADNMVIISDYPWYCTPPIFHIRFACNFTMQCQNTCESFNNNVLSIKVS
jgi:hypothetical protein